MISTLLFVLVVAWLVRATIDVGIGMLQILVGLGSALIAATIFLAIFAIHGFVWVWRTAFPEGYL
jgi:hypothetical protein